MTRRSLALAAWAIVALRPAAARPQSPAAAGMALPYVGLIESLDLGSRALAFRGPDGAVRSVTLREGAFVMSESGRRLALEELPGELGKPVAVFLADLQTAFAVKRLEDLDVAPVEARLKGLAVEEKLLDFATADGISMRLKPAVNLGAASAPGQPPGAADWAWFEQRLGQRFAVRTVEVNGLLHIWSVTALPGKPQGP